MQVRSVQVKVVLERVAALKFVSATDGVHFTLDGCCYVAKNVTDIVRDFESGKQGKTRFSVANLLLCLLQVGVAVSS